MFCSKCGYKNADDSKFCVSCGASMVQTDDLNQNIEAKECGEVVAGSEQSCEPAVKKFSGKAITGFVLSLTGIIVAGLICGILGIIYSAIAFSDIKNKNLKGRGLAIAGLVISIIDIVIMIFYYAA